jgi:MerR family transcriptional regulator, heat shock protein HspR
MIPDEQRPNLPRAVYVISIAAELAGVHPQTLRIYERKGLLDPARTGGGSRRYSDEDIAHLRRIHTLTRAGVNLEGVRRILALEAEVQRLEAELVEARASAVEAIERTRKQYRRDLVPVPASPPPTAWRR